MKPPPGESVREFYRQQGEQRERERIIKLLEAIIESIKGEQK